jgi:Mrp family chromosome partitioning ATPase
MAECDHNCAQCQSAAGCEERVNPASFKKPCHPGSHIGKVIGVVSGKGGVGKSLVTSILAVKMRRAGEKVAILDADITGPSIPKTFHVTGPVQSDGNSFYPVETKTGIKVMSLNLLLPHETDPVVWRGPIIAGALQQFWTDVIYGDIDFMFVDMPPGTGDVPLTVYQSLPLDGILVVASPQELVGMIVEKAANMARMMQIPVLGLVENYSYFQCPNCGKRYEIFGKSRIDEVAAAQGVSCKDRIPVDPSLAAAVDEGMLEDVPLPYLENAMAMLQALKGEKA